MPPLRYEDVYRLKREFPQLTIEINGGFLTHEQILPQLQQVDGVMIGRAAYDNPYLFAIADRQYYQSDEKVRSRHEVAEAMLPYIDRWVGKGLKLNKMTRHMLQLFTGQPGSRYWKRQLTERSCKPGAGAEVVAETLAEIP